MTDREFDIVLFGATGFTGRLTAHYLAEHAPAGLRWALGGRNLTKLEAVRAELAEVDDRWSDLELVVADSSDPDSMTAMAERARVVATTVGPYAAYGEPLVAACAAAGTDYADITGEPAFVDQMWLTHHATAQNSGARIVHACGFDSIPHDPGAMFTVGHLPHDVPITMRGVVRASGMPSGGTFHSAVEAMARGRQMQAISRERRRAEPRPEGRSSRAVGGKPNRDPVLGYWLLPLPLLDPFIVARSGAALASYGPDFRYSHYAGTKTLHYAAGGVLAVGAMALVAQVGPLRSLLLSRLDAGDGPDQARRDRGWFTVDFVAEAAGRVVHTRVSGGDPGYGETAKMLGESALCLAFDDNPVTSGQVTTAVAMGDNLLARLQRAGMQFHLME